MPSNCILQHSWDAKLKHSGFPDKGIIQGLPSGRITWNMRLRYDESGALAGLLITNKLDGIPKDPVVSMPPFQIFKRGCWQHHQFRVGDMDGEPGAAGLRELKPAIRFRIEPNVMLATPKPLGSEAFWQN